MSDEKRTSHGTEDAVQDTEHLENTEHRPSVRKRIADWRTSRAMTAHENAQAARLAEHRKEQERNAARDRAARAAAASRKAAENTSGTERDDLLAPVPRKMRWLAVWLDRTIGALPLLAPLILSGYFTTHVFYGEGQPINIPLGVAILAAGALEGGVWKLVALLSKTMLEGDSTVGLRASLAIYLSVISGLIYWHADWVARSQGADSGALDGWGWVPAAGAAIFSLLGVRIWMHSARFQYRVALREAGRVDKQAPKFAFLAWILTPVETPKALRHAVRYRIESPIEAVEDRRLWVAADKPRVWPVLEDTEQSVPFRQEVPSRPVPLTATVRTQTSPVPRPAVPRAERPALSSAPAPASPASSESAIDEMEDILKYAGHLLIVIDAFRGWENGPVPSVRNIRDAIHAYRQNQEDGGEFRSMSVADKVQKALIKLREHPHLVDIMNAQRGTEETS